MICRAETEGTFARFAFAHNDGKLTGFHLDHLGQVWRNHRDLEDLLLRDEVMLCDAACRLSPAEFGLVCQKWLSLADPDGSYDKFLRNLERRFLSTARDLDGNIHLAGRLDPITGEAFTRLVDRRASEMFDADWAAAEAAAADGVVLEKGMLRRSDAQRRLDALVSLVVDGSSTPEGAQRPEPMVFFGVDSVTFEEFLADMLNTDLGDNDLSGSDLNDTDLDDTSRDGADHDNSAAVESEGAADRSESGPVEDRDHDRDRRSALALPDTSAAVDPARRCETGAGFPVPFRVMLQQVLTCQIRRVVYGAPNVIVNAGHTRRLFSPTQRQLIKHRDRTCRFPGCHRDATYNETDHILAFTHGGPTDLANGQCLCRHHHQLKSRGRFFCEPMPDGRTGFFLPTGIQIE